VNDAEREAARPVEAHDGGSPPTQEMGADPAANPTGLRGPNAETGATVADPRGNGHGTVADPYAAAEPPTDPTVSEPPLTADPPPTTDPPLTDPAVTNVDGPGSGASRRGLLTPGGGWGRWTLRKRIRTGGFAQVWRATDAEGERAAIKFLLRPDAEIEARRFRRERDLGLRFQGKWLPRVLDSDLDDFVPWIAFEYLDFPALDQLVAASGPLSGEALVIFTRDLWDAVLSLHGHNVAHRDLSARNVLIDVDDGRLRLIDLGSGTMGDGTMLTAEVFPASMGFAAPEQFDVRSTKVGPAADLWSWAAVVYFAATGRTVFPVEPRMAYYEHLRTGAQPDLDGLPADLRPALAAALRTDPTQRRVDEIGSLLPLRAHEAALRAAEQRVTEADQETQALRLAVVEANRRLEQRAGDAERIAELTRRAEQAAADAALARRQLEEASVSTRQSTAATARVTELREELERALHQRENALDASDATIRALSERLARADAELTRLRSQVASGSTAVSQPPPPYAPGGTHAASTRSAPPPPPAYAPAPQAAAGRPAPARAATPAPPAWPPSPAPAASPVPAPAASGRRSVPARPFPPPPPAGVLPVTPRSRRTVTGRLFDLAMIGATLLFLFSAVAHHPATLRTLLPEPERTANRQATATVVTMGVLAAAAALTGFGRVFGRRRRPFTRRLWVVLIPLAILMVLAIYQDPSGGAEWLRSLSRSLLR
jgi:serine/threonine protein kinase